MLHADEQSYKEMIEVLRSFVLDINEQCNVIENAGSACVLLADGDSNAEKANKSLRECLAEIRSTFEPLEKAIEKLQQKLEGNDRVTPPTADY